MNSDLNKKMLYSNSLVCLLLLAVNLILLLFNEGLAKEKRLEEELNTQNQIIALQMRSQDEVNNIYQRILSLKHDLNNHLHTVSGYMQVGEYDSAQEYVEKIAGKINEIKSFHSGNAAVDALIGSKTAFAEMNGIAIDANLKLEDRNKRFIHIKILYDSGNLLLRFENATIENAQSGYFPTTKEDKTLHGFGIKKMVCSWRKSSGKKIG